MMISINNLTKYYGSKLIFDNASVAFNYDINFLHGSNGVGKTTLINILAGIVKYEKGCFYLNDHKISYRDGTYRKNIGFLIDLPNYPYHLTVQEYIELLIAMYSLDKTNKRVKELVDFYELNAYTTTKLKDLSTGFLKRTKLLASMLHDPDVYIYDEPFTGLDKEFVPKLIYKIQDLNRTKKGFIITSHSEKISLFNSDHIVNYEILNKKIVRY